MDSYFLSFIVILHLSILNFERKMLQIKSATGWQICFFSIAYKLPAQIDEQDERLYNKNSRVHKGLDFRGVTTNDENGVDAVKDEDEPQNDAIPG